jgi:amino acid transporter
MIGFLVYVVMCSLGEMATWLPAAGGFSTYAGRFVDPALGFALGYTYWFKYIIITPNQLTAAALVIQYWLPADKVNPGVWIAIFLVVICAINYFGIKFFGEFEFYLSSIKVVIILGLLILMIIITSGGVPGHASTGFRYWETPGAFKTYAAAGAGGRFLAVWSSMVTAVFAFLGTELIGVTVGEAENPRRNVPRAIKLTFWRILVFYVFSVLLLGMCVPYNSPELMLATKGGKEGNKSSATASPFVVAINEAGIQHLASIFNACILIFVFSAANSDLYIASRTLHGQALKGYAPAFFAKTNKSGVPVAALFFSASFGCLAFMNVASSAKVVFGYFVNLVSIFGLLTWISILVAHIYFVKARRAQGVDEASMRYKSPFGLWGSYCALAFCCLVALTKNFDVFIGGFDYKNFITGYLVSFSSSTVLILTQRTNAKNLHQGIPLYLIMIAGYKIVKKTKQVKPEEADLWTGKAVVDADEAEWIAKEAYEKANGLGPSPLYRYTLGYLF